MGESGEILVISWSEVTGEVRFFREAVHGLHAGGIVEVDPVECPVATGSRSVAVKLILADIVNKDVVVSIVVVCDLDLVEGGVRRMNEVGDSMNSKSVPGPCVVSVHVINGGFEERGIVTFFVEHDDAATANFANLDFLSLRRVSSAVFGRGDRLISFATGPAFGGKGVVFGRTCRRGCSSFSRRGLKEEKRKR